MSPGKIRPLPFTACIMSFIHLCTSARSGWVKYLSSSSLPAALHEKRSKRTSGAAFDDRSYLQIALIPGASGGIGREVARTFVKAGCDVAHAQAKDKRNDDARESHPALSKPSRREHQCAP